MEVKPHDYNLGLLRKTVPSFRYEGTESFDKWQERARQKLNELLGLPLEKCVDLFNIDYQKDHPQYSETRFTFQSEEGFLVPCHLLVPKMDKKKQLPLVICLQGHSTGMHISLGEAHNEEDQKFIDEEDDDYAVQAVAQGYCALTLEQRCFGESGGLPKPDCYNTAMLSIMLGRTLLGQRVWDIQRVIDVIEKHFSFIDQNKICCMGHSGGGTATFYAACIDERIALAMSSGALCTFEKSIATIKHCTCNYVPNIAKYFDMGDLSGLVAPRKLVMVSGNQDPIFPIEGAMETYSQICRMFKYAGVQEHFSFVTGDGGHRFYADAWKNFNQLLNK